MASILILMCSDMKSRMKIIIYRIPYSKSLFQIILIIIFSIPELNQNKAVNIVKLGYSFKNNNKKACSLISLTSAYVIQTQYLPKEIFLRKLIAYSFFSNEVYVSQKAVSCPQKGNVVCLVAYQFFRFFELLLSLSVNHHHFFEIMLFSQ